RDPYRIDAGQTERQGAHEIAFAVEVRDRVGGQAVAEGGAAVLEIEKDSGNVVDAGDVGHLTDDRGVAGIAAKAGRGTETGSAQMEEVYARRCRVREQSLHLDIIHADDQFALVIDRRDAESDRLAREGCDIERGRLVAT